MTLDQSFRKAIEIIGLKKIDDICFWNIVRDFHHISNAYSFIWRIMINQGIVDEFLNLTDSDEELHVYITQICYNTGLDLEKVQTLLMALRDGVLSAFYGKYPAKNTKKILFKIYENNKTSWKNRVEELHDGTIIVGKDGIYGIHGVKDEILPIKYRGATEFQHGLGCFNYVNKTGFINILGNLEIDMGPITDQLSCIVSIEPFYEGISELNGINNKVAYLSINGNFTDCVYDKISLSILWDGCRIISKDGLKGVMNNKCEIIVEPQFSVIKKFNKDTYFILGKNEEGEWSIIHKNGVIKKFLFKNPTILNNDIIQDIIIDGDQARYNFYNTEKRLISDICVVNRIGSKSIPILIQCDNRNYYFMDKCGKVGNLHGYEMAYPFVTDYTWVKIGCDWLKIDKIGKILYVMNDAEVLSKEINGHILRRSKTSSLIEVFNCENYAIEYEIGNSNTTMINEIINDSYDFFIFGKYYLWSGGQLFSADIPFILESRDDKIFSCSYDDGTIRIIINGTDFGKIKKLNVTDEFWGLFQLNNHDEIIVFLTEKNLSYMYNKTKNIYSDYYQDIECFSKYENHTAVRAIDSDNKCVLVNSDFKIVAKGDEIEITSNENYYKIVIQKKVGLISYDGSTVIEAKYDSLNYYKSFI